jgi:D-tyrosyl-tRNA(Tyr) deacylase
MRAVIQRVKQASVEVGGEQVGGIEQGLLVFLAVHKEDREEVIGKMAEKVVNLRIFEKEKGRMDISVRDMQGGILVVSQFTLYGDCRKGARPSFMDSAGPDKARPFYEKFIQLLKNKGLPVESGRFGEMMEVSLINDGPVTLVVDL